MARLNSDILAARLDARAREDLEACRVGGLGISVMQGGRVLYKRYHGLRSQASGEAFTPENGDATVFRLASMSKPITAVATLIQVGRGLLELDTPIAKWLPAFETMEIGEPNGEGGIRVTGVAKTPLTPRILLDHTNGLGTLEIGNTEMGGMTPADKVDVAHVADYIATQPLAFEPMSMQYYSPVWAFDVLARLIEVTAGQDFATFLKENIFDPCGMTETTFTPTNDQWARMVAMHGREETAGADETAIARSVDVPMVPGCVFGDIPPTWPSGGAGLASTLPDYVRFAEMLRRRGVTEDGTRILTSELVDAMGTPWVPEALMPCSERWGLGVRVIVAEDYWMPKGCFGWSGAYGTHFWVDPANDITVVLMRNSAYDGGAGARLACQLEQDVYSALEAED